MGHGDSDKAPKSWSDWGKNVALGTVVFAALWCFSVATTSWPGFGESKR